MNDEDRAVCLQELRGMEEEEEAPEEEEELDEASEEDEQQAEEEEVDDDEEQEDENDYEAQRQRNIARNQEMLRQLGLLADGPGISVALEATPSLADTSPAAVVEASALLPIQPSTPLGLLSMQIPKRKYKPRQKRTPDTPTRTSSRLQTKSRRSYAENSFFKNLSPEEQAQVMEEEKAARERAKDKEEAGNDDERSRNNNKWIGSRLYDSQRGITCHQCRQKTVDEKTTCANEFKIHTPARHHYCRRCLWNRYGEALDEVRKDPTWVCPGCRGLCNCSFCRKKRGQAPTGVLDSDILQKYSSVAEYLQKDRNEKPAVSEEELEKMRQEIEKEVKEGIRPSGHSSNSVVGDELSNDLNGGLFYVEAIVEHRSTPAGMEYLIKWLGYGYEHNTWEPAAHLNCPHLIREYHIRNGLSLAGKRGRKKKIIGQPTHSTSEDEKAKEQHEDEEEEEEEEEEVQEQEQEQDIKEWETRRPGRPKGRGPGRPRLVMGTGRGPRHSAETTASAAAPLSTSTSITASGGATPVAAVGLGYRKRGRPKKELLMSVATGKMTVSHTVKRKLDEPKASENEEATTTTETHTQARSRRKDKESGMKGKEITPTGNSKNKRAKTDRDNKSNQRRKSMKEANQVRSSRKRQDSQIVVTPSQGGRRSKRLAERSTADARLNEDELEHDEAKGTRSTRGKKRPRYDMEEEETISQTRPSANTRDQESEEATEASEPKAKTLYWDEPVEKGKRRRSAPILLSDDFIILGNGQLRGSKAFAASGSTPKQEGGETTAKKRKSVQKGDARDKAKTTSPPSARNRKKNTEKNGEGEKVAKKAKSAPKQAKKRSAAEAKPSGEENRERKSEEEDAAPRQLYWETEVSGKRKRAPNFSYLTDFLLEDYLRSARASKASKKSKKSKKTK